MPSFDAADLFDRLRDATARPATDASLTAARGMRYLSDAQRAVAYTMASHIPHVNYGAPVQLTTLNRQTYTLPGGEWIGRVLLMRTLKGEPLIEGGYDDPGADYTVEGPSSIRITAGRTWPGDAPYVRYMPKPGDMDLNGAEPTLKPVEVLRAVVQTAAAIWARRGGHRDPQPYLDEAYAILWGRPNTPEIGLIPSYKNQQAGSATEFTPWWRVAV